MAAELRCQVEGLGEPGALGERAVHNKDPASLGMEVD